MAIGQEVRPEEVGRTLSAELAQADGLVRGLWMTTARGELTFWILTPPIDLPTQQGLYERTAILYERFPTIEFLVHILNPEWYEGDDALAELPADARPIPLTVA